ncbi:MAG: hypothetical protein Q9191_000694 [Dirinaria sp. TL-2023a]
MNATRCLSKLVMGPTENTSSSKEEILSRYHDATNEILKMQENDRDEFRRKAAAVARGLLESLETPEEVVMRWAWEQSKFGESASEPCVRRYPWNVAEQQRFSPEDSNDRSAQVQIKMHEYMQSHGYKVPTSATDGPFQWVFNTRLSYFEHLNTDPEAIKDFSTLMSGARGTRKQWTDWFPVQSEIMDKANDGIVLVDVGGSKGHDLQRFEELFPKSSGRLILQDLPDVLAESPASLRPGIEPMAHNFFELQPVKGTHKLLQTLIQRLG